MRVLYPYPEPLSDRKARHLQSWRTALALSELMPVTLALGGENSLGTAKGGGQLEVLQWPRWMGFGPLKVSWQRRFFERCDSFLQSAPKDTIVFARHLRLAEFLLKRRPGIRLVFEVHEFFSDGENLSPERRLELREMEEEVARSAAGLICISQGLAAALKDRFGRSDRVLVAPDACDPSAAVPGNPDVDLIYAGSLHPWKGADTLVQAMAHMPNRRCRIVGGAGGSLVALRGESFRWGVSDRCELAGHVSHADVAKLLGKARIGVLPNHPHAIGTHFTSPLKAFEYLAAGLPVVASDLPSLREILPEDATVFVAPRSPRSLAVAANRLLKDPARLQAMSEAARRAAQKHSWEARARAISQFLRDLGPRES